MPLPASWSLVPVSGTYTNHDGTAAAGTIVFHSSQQVTIGGVIIVPKMISVELDGSGSFAISLPSTDDPDLSVGGWAYRVVEHIPNGRAGYDIFVPRLGGAINLATVVPAVLASTLANSAVVPLARMISTTAPLTGGGDLTADRVFGISPASSAAAGSMSAVDKAKLDGVAVGATANGGAGVSSVSGSAPIVSSGGATPVVSITPATTAAPGSLSAADKVKLDGVSGVNTGDQTSIAGNAGTATALQAAGADRSKLDGVAAGATANSTDAALRDRALHTGTQVAATVSDFAGAADARIALAVIDALADVTITTPVAGQVIKRNAGNTGWINDTDATGAGSTVPTGTGFRRVTAGAEDAAAAYPTKADVGLSLADNTSDADKPVSAAQAAANVTDRDRANHTGTQAVATVTMATARLLGRSTAGAGAVEEILLGAGLSFSGTTLNTTAGDSVLGRHMIPVMAGAIQPSVTGGSAAVASIASAASQPDIVTLNFDTTTQEFAQFAIPMPESWNESTITFQPIWSHAATTTNFGVVWGLQAVAASDLDPIAVAFGTAQLSSDTGGVTNSQYIGPMSAAITVGGAPLPGDTVFFRVFREPLNAADTLAIDARLHGIRLYMTTNAAVD